MSQGQDGRSRSAQGQLETDHRETTATQNGRPSPAPNSSGCRSKSLRWLILMMCCILGFTSWGLALSMGSLLNDVMDTFEVSRAPAALVQSLCLGVCLMGGLVVGPLLHRFGPRVTVVGGSLVAALGGLVAFFATNIALVIIGMGVLTGLGLSGNFLTGQVIAPLMFHNIRSIVLALISMSNAAGSIVYPLFLRYLVNTYALRGAYLIVGAVNLQMALLGVFIGAFNPRQQDTGKESEVTTEKERNQENRTGDSIDQETIFIVCGSSSSDSELKGRSSEICKDDSGLSKVENTPGDKLQRPGGSGCVCGQCSVRELHCTPLGQGATGDEMNEYVNEQKDHLGVHGQTEAEAPVNKPICAVYLSILRNWRCTVFFLLGILPVILFNATPLLFLVDLATADGLNVVDGAFFLSMLAVGNVGGRFLAGVFHYFLDSRIVIAHCVCMMTAGVSAFCFTIVDSYSGYLAASVVYGINWGFLTTCIAMSTLELVGRDKYAVAVGIATSSGGIGMSVSGPAGGLIRDQTGSFFPMFCTGLVQGIVSGCVLIGVSLWPKRSCCRRSTDSFQVTSQ